MSRSVEFFEQKLWKADKQILIIRENREVMEYRVTSYDIISMLTVAQHNRKSAIKPKATQR